MTQWYGYANHRFQGQDPDLRLLYDAIKLVAIAENVSFGTVLTRISKTMGSKSPSMLRRWFTGTNRTISPRHLGLAACANAIGMEFKLMDIRKPRVRTTRRNKKGVSLRKQQAETRAS